MDKRITCKVHDDKEIIKEVGVGGERVYPIIAVWNDITNGRFEFYTLVDGRKVTVKARTTPQGTKYLTTHPDGYTPNNLDELRQCA